MFFRVGNESVALKACEANQMSESHDQWLRIGSSVMDIPSVNQLIKCLPVNRIRVSPCIHDVLATMKYHPFLLDC